MRRGVPFIGEQQITRADTELERAKRSMGSVIDDVVNAVDAESSWDDIVRPDGAKSDEVLPRRSGVGVSRPAPNAKALAKSSGLKYASGAGSSGSVNKASGTSERTTVFVKTGLPTLEWVSMNNGNGLRITVSGSIDHSLRGEWNRLLDETEGSDAGDFEFNLTQTPSLSLTGLGMLLLFKERKSSKRDAIRLCHCTKEVSQLLHWTGMDKYFVIMSDQQDLI